MYSPSFFSLYLVRSPLSLSRTLFPQLQKSPPPPPSQPPPSCVPPLPLTSPHGGSGQIPLHTPPSPHSNADPAIPTVVMADPLRCCVVGVGVLRPRVVMTACGKNGVGKTPTMANLSASLARLGLPVVAVDADAGPSQPGPAAGHGSCFFRDLPLIAFIYIRKYD